MKINYFQKGGTQYDLNRQYVINSAQASGNYDDLRKMIESDGGLYNPRQEAINRFVAKGGTEAGFNRMDQLADEVYSNFIKNNPIDTSFLKPIQRQQTVVKPATDWNKIAVDNNFKDMEAVKAFQTWANTQGYNLAVDGKLGKLTGAALNDLGSKYTDYLNNPEVYNRGLAHGMNSGSPVTPPAPLQTQPSITKASIPVYDANGNPTGEQKTVYYGRGQYPKRQTIQEVNNQPQTPTIQTKPLSMWQTIWQNMAKPLPSMSASYSWRYKKGGKMNYFQQGGQMQQDPVGQVIQGLLQDPQATMQALSQMQGQQGGKEQVNAILQEIVRRAKGGDQQAVQAVQVLQQAMQGQQQTQPAPQQAQIAEKGAKLNYFRKLKGLCPEGEEMVYMKNGGCLCQKKKDGGEAKINKKQFFGKDKKVSKAQEGKKITETKKEDKAGNGIITQTDSVGNSVSNVYGPKVPNKYIGKYGGPERHIEGQDTIYLSGPNLARSTGDTIVDKSSIINLRNLFNSLDTIPTQSITTFRLPSDKKGGKLDKSEKKQFFKKEQKKPLDKCGGKMKAKKK